MPPPSPPSNTTSPTPHSLTTTLTAERNILHLLVYKSKNQHRRSLWFKWLQMLKRSLERILSHLLRAYPPRRPRRETQQSTTSQTNTNKPDSSSESESESSDEETAILTLTNDKIFKHHLSRLQLKIIPGSYTAFTHLVKSTQYAGMGMVMLGSLARVHEVLKVYMDEPINMEDTKVEIPASTKDAEDDDIPMASEGEDLGEVISRDSIDLTKIAQKVTMQQKLEAHSEDDFARELKVTTTEKKEKGTAIDDLFAGFM
ncbi:hypothetical protein ABW19_dt0201923 [Dactylella cylindrospora]|nr:hypothetical protein ABW19_dt0201923 [Dactylella cylindrospora]